MSISEPLYPHVDELLEKEHLKKTPLRRHILGALMELAMPMSQADLLTDLEQKLGAVERVSVYRNLLQLKRVGLVHEVEVNHYVVCLHECENHSHVVLFCQSCQKHKELKDHRSMGRLLEELARLRFFSAKAPLMVRGCCAECAQKNALDQNRQVPN